MFETTTQSIICFNQKPLKRHQQLEVPEASVGRIWEEELSYI